MTNFRPVKIRSDFGKTDLAVLAFATYSLRFGDIAAAAASDDDDYDDDDCSVVACMTSLHEPTLSYHEMDHYRPQLICTKYHFFLSMKCI